MSELGHWRYMVDKLERWQRNNKKSLQYSENDAHRFPENAGIQRIYSEHRELTQLGDWLLEEARYKAADCLGDTTHPHHPAEGLRE